MALDIRIPIGAMFAIIGLLLFVYGVFTAAGPRVYEKSLSINVNLWWGAAMLVFGLVMFYFGRHGNSSVRLAEESAEGRAMEAHEHSARLKQD
ncbi:MAG: hypothetical protein H0V62_03975 [Gammaproteobacteria bacterium]|nr:hypothetical protein [Gammaproteobacteria bacterium]